MSDCSRLTDIPGIGKMVCYMRFEFNRFNINNDTGSDKYNEGDVRYRCENDRKFSAFFTDKDADLVDDDFNIYGEIISKGYRFVVRTNSEVKAPLWDNGTVEFLYSTSLGHWTMRGNVGEKEWTFCRPDKALDLILAGLECMLDAGEERFGGYESQIRLVYESIKKDREHIIKTSALYENRPGCLRP